MISIKQRDLKIYCKPWKRTYFSWCSVTLLRERCHLGSFFRIISLTFLTTRPWGCTLIHSFPGLLMEHNEHHMLWWISSTWESRYKTFWLNKIGVIKRFPSFIKHWQENYLAIEQGRNSRLTYNEKKYNENFSNVRWFTRNS